MNKADIQAKIKDKKERLEAYRNRELEILKGGVQSYGIGSRNVTRYNVDLASIRSAIKDLEKEIAELEALLGGGNVRKAVGVILRDW